MVVTLNYFKLKINLYMLLCKYSVEYSFIVESPTKIILITISVRVYRVNGDPADLRDQNLKDLENSLSRQLTEKIKSLSSVMRDLKVVMSECFYINKN